MTTLRLRYAAFTATTLLLGCRNDDEGGRDDTSSGMGVESAFDTEPGSAETVEGEATEGDSDEPGSESTGSPSALDGVWVSRGYGLLLEISETEVQPFEYTTISCIALDAAPTPLFLGEFDVLQLAPDVLEVRDVNALSPQVFDRVSAMPEHCRDGGTPVAGDVDYERDALRDFDVVFSTFAEQYAFFELRGVDWAAHGAEIRRGLTPATDDVVLFSALAELMAPLDDGHVSLESRDDEYEAGSVEFIELLRAEFDAQTEVADFIEYAAAQFSAHIDGIVASLDEAPSGGAPTMLWGVLDESVGYFAFFDFDPDDYDSDLAELDTALDSMTSMDAVIIDLRFNTGGSDFYALQVASRFFDEERVVFSKSARHGDMLTEAVPITLVPYEGLTYTGPVYVITTHSTVSAAEVFSLSLAEAPHVVIAGHRSNGIFSDILERKLPNGWAFGLSNEVYTSAGGNVFEGVGVPVDMPIELPAFPLGDRDSGHDSWIDALRTAIRSR